MDIRTQTCLIIKRGHVFLVGTICYSRELRWSDSPWAAWRTRKWEKAEKLAAYTAGDLWLFNPISGELREVRHGYSHAN